MRNELPEEFSEIMCGNDVVLGDRKGVLLGYHGTLYAWIEWENSYVTIEPIEKLAGGVAVFPAPEVKSEPKLIKFPSQPKL